MDGRAVSEEVCDNVNAYLAIYCVILVLSFAIISVDGFSIGTNFSAVASCFNNIGPGFELVGAHTKFQHLQRSLEDYPFARHAPRQTRDFPTPAPPQPRHLEPQKITFCNKFARITCIRR